MAECNNNFRCGWFQFKDFIDSPLWQDILQEIQNWENKIVEELTVPTYDAAAGKMEMSQPERAMYDEMLRGHLRALGEVKRIPSTIMEIIEQSKQETVDDEHGTGTGDEFEFDE